MYTPSQILYKIGLNEKESGVYLKCLEFGGLTVTGLKRLLGFPRTTLYDTLQKLEAKGYISKSKRNQTLTFYAVSIQELTGLIEDKVQDFTRKKELLQKNTEIFQQLIKGSHITPQVKMYQGNDALSLIYEQAKKSELIRTIYSTQTSTKYLDDSLISTVHQQHKQQDTHKKILLIYETGAQKEKEELLSYGFEVKILPPGFPIHADIMIMETKLLFVSYGELIHALEIQEMVFIQAQRAMFDMIRESLE